MAETKTGLSETLTKTSRIVTTDPGRRPGENRSLTIKLRKRKTDKKVGWSTDTVDNEHLGRRSSKCCCIYKKPRAFGESSTESEEEHDESCGHVHCIRGHCKGPRRTPAPLSLRDGTSPSPPDPPQN
ncbi:E3 ubiquitin-protein ligase PPP1R11-like [Antechinus flavipes]|uniref:E3 ubiquitin-protein ligase PPP1R11-like n=1 Tax=Antechinus flavipes TaxID=38775 RepID=UPI002235ADDB|nr:E3 ubiquitin-protein ligase PPP1R11-like [Antechinus flavipes]